MITKVANRTSIYDASALLVTITVIVLDHYTKSLVVTYLSPARSKSVSLIGQYLLLYYVRNSGAAFSLFRNKVELISLIAVALIVVGYIYLRMLNSGPLYYKVIFGLIIGGALGNVIDRIHNGGYVVDFIALRIPQLNFYFAIFNVADACITLGALLLFVFIFFTPRSHNGQHPETYIKRNKKS